LDLVRSMMATEKADFFTADYAFKAMKKVPEFHD
jgi:hypothetical protein